MSNTMSTSKAKPTTKTQTARKKQTAIPGSMSPIAPQLVVEIELDDIRQDPTQPRRMFSLASIADTLEADEQGVAMPLCGIREPIWVRLTKPGEPNKDLDGMQLHGKAPKYTIIEGERRFRAALQKGFKTIPCVIAPEEYTRDEATILALQLGASIGKAPLLPLELADGLARLVRMMPEDGEEGICKRTGLGVRKVRRYLRLANLCEEVRTAFALGEINEAVAVELAALDTHDDQHAAYEMSPANVTAAQMRSIISAKFHLQLVPSKCGFDPDDKSLAPIACSSCSKNTAVQRSLWADEAAETPMCTDRACYMQKQAQSKPAAPVLAPPPGKPRKSIPSPTSAVPMRTDTHDEELHATEALAALEDSEAESAELSPTMRESVNKLATWCEKATELQRLRLLALLLSKMVDVSGRAWATSTSKAEEHLLGLAREAQVIGLCIDLLVERMSSQQLRRMVALTARIDSV